MKRKVVEILDGYDFWRILNIQDIVYINELGATSVERWVAMDDAGLFYISDLGRIKSFCRDAPIIRKMRHDKSGYLYTALSAKVTVKAHRLVAEKFVPNPENKPCVNHRDGNKRNNTASNLEWCTIRENIHHAINNGIVTGVIRNGVKYNKIGVAIGENHGRSKLNNKQVLEIRRLGSTGVKKAVLARQFSVAPTTIAYILDKRLWRHIL